MARFEAGGERAATLPSRMSLGENKRDRDGGTFSLPYKPVEQRMFRVFGVLTFSRNEQL